MLVFYYETVSQHENESPEQFEIYQSIQADSIPLHPEAGKLVRRIITGGMLIPKRSGMQHALSGGACCGTC